MTRPRRTYCAKPAGRTFTSKHDVRSLESTLRLALTPRPIGWVPHGVCRRLDPTTGRVIALIDPITRQETPVA